MKQKTKHNLNVPFNFEWDFFMKKVILLLFILWMNSSMFAQNGVRKFRLQINLTSQVSYRYIFINEKNTSLNSTYEAIIQSRNDYEIPALTFAGGLGISYQINEKISIEGGLNYNQRGYKTKWFDINVGDPAYNFSARYKINFRYIEVPLNMVYAINGNNFNLGFGLAPAFLFRVDSKDYIKLADGSSNKSLTPESIVDFSKFHLSATLKVGYNISISDAFELRPELFYNHGITKITDSPISGYFWNTGVNIILTH